VTEIIYFYLVIPFGLRRMSVLFWERHGLDSTKGHSSSCPPSPDAEISCEEWFLLAGLLHQVHNISPKGQLSLSPWLPQHPNFPVVVNFDRSETTFTSMVYLHDRGAEQVDMWRRMRNALFTLLVASTAMEIFSFQQVWAGASVRSLHPRMLPDARRTP